MTHAGAKSTIDCGTQRTQLRLDFLEDALDVLSLDVFRLAIALEKDAILFFWEFLPYVNDNDKKVVRTLMDEQKATSGCSGR